MTMQFSVANMLNRSKQSSISDHIMAAMEYVQANVMIADADLRIIYMNRTMRDMMERNESAIRTELPNFNARNLIGQTADIFHVRPSHQRDMIERLRTAHSTTIRVGGRIFNLIATPLFDTSGNRIGTVVEWDDKTDRVTAEERLKEIAAENMRVRRALDDCQASVMIADNDYTIVYMNDTMQEMMKANEAALRTELRNFDAARLIGANIDIFHKNPAHQRSMLQSLNSAYKTQITVGGRVFSLIASPVLDRDGARLGTVVEWEDRTERLAAEAARDAEAAANAQIKTALNKCTTNVMLADVTGKIIFANEAVLAMMLNAERDLQKELPNFEARKLVGANFDIFHKNPAHQRNMLERLNTTHRASIAVGARKFDLIANPVFDAHGTRLGTVVEWKDVTLERQVEGELSTVVSAISSGDFSTKLSVEGKDGFMLRMAEGINNISAICSSGLTDIGNMLRALSAGDLTQRITADYQGMFDRVKQDCNATAERLSEIVRSISKASSEVANAAAEIASGSTDLAERTESQASALEQTAAAMEEMAATVRSNSENAQSARQMARAASDVATNGDGIVQNAVSAMSQIERSSQKISDIIGVIDEIAFQTNLLALNAAVEAARAGDAGRGFAVVATEVRNLAGRSSQAAKDIKSLISESGQQVQQGVTLVNEAGHSLRNIISSINQVTSIVNDIASASEEQSSGIDEINKSVTQMDDMTQQNSALVEENAAAARELEMQARVMKEEMSFFAVDGLEVPVATASVRRSSPKASLSKPAALKKPAASSARKTSYVLPKPKASVEAHDEDNNDWSEF